MQAHCRDFHAPVQKVSTDHPSCQLECLFILLCARVMSLARFTSFGRIADIAWSRLPGLITPIMSLRSPCRLIRPSLVIVCALALTPCAQAQTVPDQSAAELVRREILAVYDGREEPRPDQTRIHRFAEMPLNHLGLVVTY